MNPTLALRLIEKGAIRTGTEVDVRYQTRSLAMTPSVIATATFSVTSCSVADAVPLFEGYDVRDGARRRFTAASIVAIDGMDPVRIAAIHHLTAEGKDIIPPKKRGRRPKIRIPQENTA